MRRPLSGRDQHDIFEDVSDPGEADREEDLWFLPGPIEDEDDVPPGAAPFPMSSRTQIFDISEWRRAQGEVVGDLAGLTQLFGELDLRLHRGPEGLGQRLALREAADLSWWAGDRISIDRLGLWHALRIGSAGDSEQALSRAGWALRRLMAGPSPLQGLATFLERQVDEKLGAPTGLSELRPEAGAAAELSLLLSEADDLHPVVQSALLFHAWRMLGAPLTRDMEAAVLAARHAAQISRRPGRGALFLPLAQGGQGALRGGQKTTEKLAAWVRGATHANLAALLHLERLDAWEAAATEVISDRSGRTPAKLIRCVLSWPMVTTALAEKDTGASRAACQRNLDLLTSRGLIREVTGQGRYRLWSACV